MRSETRRQRYDAKLASAQRLSVSLVSINFLCDENLAFLIRSAACFGANRIDVIGGMPERNKLRNKSGTLLDYVQIRQFTSIEAYLNQLDEKLVVAELTEGATSIYDYKFPLDEPISIVVGNETTGCPIEFILRGDLVYIPMTAVGYCLNTAQTANVFLYEYVHQSNKWNLSN